MNTLLSAMFRILPVLLAAAAGSSRAQTASPPTPTSGGKLSGHIDIVSRCYLRGITTTYDNGTPLRNLGGCTRQ